MASTVVAFGLRTGNKYSAQDIDDNARHALMQEEGLVDTDDVPLIPVRRRGSPHFRRLGKSAPVKMLPRGQRSERHRETIDELHETLVKSGNRIEIYTNFFTDGQKEWTEQTLFSLRPDSEFRWYVESPIRFDDFKCIQPDLAGRDLGRMAPTGRIPAVIIEVVDTHLPDLATFERLLSLSRSAHHVYFYILEDGKRLQFQKLNHFDVDGSGKLKVRFTWALLNGELVKNGDVRKLMTTTPADRAREALGILTKAARSWARPPN